jgi:adenosine deaminase
MRGDNNKNENLETIAVAKKFYKNGVCAVDLAGAEALYKTNTFGYVFDSAIRSEMPMTIHCGEADGKNSVWYAMKTLECSNQKSKRFGHGIRILEDEVLAKEAIDNGFFFELCPTSNLNTKLFSSYSEYPVKEMLKKGMRVTINTDNCSVSDTTIADEFNYIIAGNKLSNKEVEKLLHNAVDASFASENAKMYMHKKIDVAMEG